MIIRLRRKALLVSVLVLLLAAGVVWLTFWAAGRKRAAPRSDSFAGGVLVAAAAQPADGDAWEEIEDYNERYHRPSKKTGLENPYTLLHYTADQFPAAFDYPENALLAYYGVLREAANMEGYAGGCGSVGDGDMPYPLAYAMLSAAQRQTLTLGQFTASFRGIGHITLLTLAPLPGGDDMHRNFMIEVEMITGRPVGKSESNNGSSPGLFEYYYGVASAVKEGDGWKVGGIRYLPEDFLCAPYHSWFYDAEAATQIIYKENLHLVEILQKPVEEDGRWVVYGEKDGAKYRFDFVRLANGYDILIGEYKQAGGQWEAVDLLGESYPGFKLE